MSYTSIIRRTSALILLVAFFTSCHKDVHNMPQPAALQHEFIDNFLSDTHNWSFSDPADSAYVTINNGILDYYYNPPTFGSNTVAINTGCNINSTFSISETFVSNNIMGLAFGVSNTNYGYAFLIDNTGKFALYNEESSGLSPQAIIDWQSSTVIKVNDYNTVEIDQTGSTWKGYINGTQVFVTPAQNFSGSKIGFIVLSGTEGYANNLTVQWN